MATTKLTLSLGNSNLNPSHIFVDRGLRAYLDTAFPVLTFPVAIPKVRGFRISCSDLVSRYNSGAMVTVSWDCS